MSLVFIVGAGASHGESLKSYLAQPPPLCQTDATPPITTGFFNGDFLESIGYHPEDAEKDFSDAFVYIRWLKQIGKNVPVGQGPWKTIDLEEILTSIELSREFQDSDSDAGAQYVLIRNKLVRYLWRVIACCTLRKYGTHSRKLVQSLPWDATLITFNYDLLLDQEQIDEHEELCTQYQYFSDLVLDRERVLQREATGLFLKMHGSLNWFRCANGRCPSNSGIQFERDTTHCLNRALGINIGGDSCRYCGSETIPVIVPPVLRKPITEDSLLRTIWGQAKQKLSCAEAVVLIGFSAAPTDFYASWLIRSTVGVQPDLCVFVVNPANDPGHFEHGEHRNRMAAVFTAQIGTDRYDDHFRTFAEIEDILDLLRRRGFIRNA